MSEQESLEVKIARMEERLIASDKALILATATARTAVITTLTIIGMLTGLVTLVIKLVR